MVYLQNFLKQTYISCTLKFSNWQNCRGACGRQRGESEDITVWRPNLLLNYENKIFTKILANKIQPTLEDIIDPDQTAALKGRTIIKNLQLNRNVMSYANSNKIQAAMIALDPEKKFVRMDWNFLFKALAHYDYGPEITQIIKTFYRNTGKTDQGKRTLVSSVPSKERTAARIPVIYDFFSLYMRKCF